MIKNKQHIGFLHPGAMGISLAATAQNSGHIACWVSAGRSVETRRRAEQHNLVEIKTLEALCETCSVIVSVCPPHAAVAVAEQVAACSFKGVYADVNAVSPQRVLQVAELVSGAGAEFVDGGIIGLPAWTPAATWLYLSGAEAHRVAECFAAGPLETEVIGDEIGKASALKMCFAANSKGTIALLCAILAAAEKLGVRSELEKQWSRNGSDFVSNTHKNIERITNKAWRFSGEMQEIAATLEAAGLPGDFHKAAHNIYNRIAKFKGVETVPPMEEILQAVLNPREEDK